MHSVTSKVLFSIFLRHWRQHVLLQRLSRTGYSAADDSSLDLSQMFPPLHFSPLFSVFHPLLLFLIPLHLSPSLPPLFIQTPKDVNCIMSSVYSLCSDSSPLFCIATMCLTPHEVQQHTDQPDSRPRGWSGGRRRRKEEKVWIRDGKVKRERGERENKGNDRYS